MESSRNMSDMTDAKPHQEAARLPTLVRHYGARFIQDREQASSGGRRQSYAKRGVLNDGEWWVYRGRRLICTNPCWFFLSGRAAARPQGWDWGRKVKSGLNSHC